MFSLFPSPKKSKNRFELIQNQFVICLRTRILLCFSKYCLHYRLPEYEKQNKGEADCATNCMQIVFELKDRESSNPHFIVIAVGKWQIFDRVSSFSRGTRFLFR